MKIALVFPRFKYPSGDPPIGISYIASLLREQTEVDLEIIDTTFYQGNSEKLIKQIFSQKSYDIVGISCMTTMIRDGLRISQVIKKHFPATKVIFGGPHPTVLPDETLKNPYVDAICIGEGEITFLEIVQQGGNFINVHGLWYKNAHGDVIKNNPREIIENIDVLPYPAFDLLPMEEYIKYWFQLDSVAKKLRGINILTSRGCPYRCSFCQPTLCKLFGKKLRQRSPANVISEIVWWKEKYGINAVMFQDDTLVVNRRWIEELCDLLIINKTNISWGCNTRVDLVERDMFLKMRQAGLRKAFIGIESGSQRVLDEIYNKKITHDQVIRAVSILKSIDIKIQGYFMIGAPTETEKEIESTIKFSKTLDIDEATFSITTPLPGTLLYDNTKKHINQKIDNLDYYSKSIYDDRISLGHNKLNWLKKKAMLMFYLSPKHIVYTLKSFASIEAAKKSFMKLQRF
jgi:anaerobic magnesium-protoporphyrin IX monomethyl ester cyclase